MKFVTVAFCIIATQKVSLFTREWIEISIPTTQNQQENVSLFTREWIEITWFTLRKGLNRCLPLYEGVD